ncbi:MAG: ribosomal protein S18-alanine N-acetyltransferase [Calditrichaeota bacterium]|nr:ribosomal protein S18-alanine N-acetyltransferase [Calditrichota bacterium]MCB9366340.1 ribosomal protein S18-alanine N-acetyltransferase [Calditrichota bacterium]
MPLEDTSYQIAELTADHLHAVLSIERDSFKDPWSLSAFRNFIVLYRTSWVILDGSEIIGYIVSQWVLDEIHVLNVAVHKQRRREGIASALLDFLFDRARAQKMSDVYLEVRESNEAARGLYARYGFAELGIRKSYYHDGEDALVMHRRVRRSDRGSDAEGA